MYPATHMLGSRRNGLNHVSMNLGTFDRETGPLRATNYPLYSDALLDWYVARSGFYAWKTRAPSARALADAYLTEQIKAIWKASRETPDFRS